MVLKWPNRMLKKCATHFFLLSMCCASGYSFGEAPRDCDHLIANFINQPDESTRAMLDQGAGDCWAKIQDSNEKIDALATLVRNGKRSAVAYLAPHLRQLDGGNLEDALIALGVFAESNMEEFLDLESRGELTSREASDSLTMLPLPLSDDLRAQLVTMRRRRAAVIGVSRTDLAKVKTHALSTIDKFIVEIKSVDTSSP